MEVSAVDSLGGRELSVDVDTDATLSDLKRQCGEAFGFGDDVELSIAGELLSCDNADPVSSISSVTNGCHVAVRRGVQRYVQQLNARAVKMNNLPEWAHHHPDCVTAALKWLPSEDRTDLYTKAVGPRWLSPSLRGDRAVMMEAVRCDAKNYFLISPDLRRDKGLAIAALQRRPELFHHLDTVLQEDSEVALVAPQELQSSSPLLKDKQFVLTALSNNTVEKYSSNWKNAKVYRMLGQKLRANKTVALKVLGTGGVSFADLSPKLRGDVKVVKKAFETEYPDMFRHASEEIRCNKEVVLAIMNSAYKVRDEICGQINEAACRDEEDRSDDEDDLEVILKRDRKATMMLLREDALDTGCLEIELRTERDFYCDALVRTDMSVLYMHTAESLRGDKAVFLKALKWALGSEVSDIFRHTTDAIRSDKAVALKAVECQPSAYSHFTAELRADKDIAVQVSSSQFRYMPDALRNDLEVALPAINHDPQNFAFAGEGVRGSKCAALAAFVNRTGDTLLSFASVELQGDREVVLRAVAVNPHNAIFASPALRGDLPEYKPEPPATPFSMDASGKFTYFLEAL